MSENSYEEKQRHEKKMEKIREFVAMNKGPLSSADAYAFLYRLVHTAYAKNVGDFKKEICGAWQAKTDNRISERAWSRIYETAPVFTRNSLADDVRNGRALNQNWIFDLALVELEFDLWLIKTYESGAAFDGDSFRKQMNEKYGRALSGRVDNMLANDFRMLDDLAVLAPPLFELKKEITEFFDCLCRANKSRMDAFAAAKNDGAEADEGGAKSSGDVAALANELRQKDQIIAEYKLAIDNLSEKNKRLSRDIEEFKRQRDEVREYSAMQYDRGVRDLFNLANDSRYSKPLDYLYSLRTDSDDDVLATYLDNFFMALEEMDIVPILEDKKMPAKIDALSIVRDYNLTFDKSEFNSKKIAVKYAGWKYKNMILEKPTLEKKTE